jgi:hypothetical protein
MKAIKITTDNEIKVVTVPEPTWKGMGQLVGGHFEHVRPWGLYNLDTPYKGSLCMIVNEEGRLIGLEHNLVGTALYNNTPTPLGFEPIVGDILIMTEGFVNGEPDIIGLDEEQLEIVKKALKNNFKYLTEEVYETN